MKERIMAYIAVGMTLAACSTDDGEQQQERRDVAFSMPVEEWRSGTVATRAPSTLLAPVTAQNPTTIGVWGYSNDGWMQSCDEPPAPMRNVEFTYEAAGDKLYHKGTWNQSTNKAEDGAYPWGSDNNKAYTFYAYAPHTSGATYDKDAKQLTLTIPAVGTTDYLIAKKEKSHNTHNDGAIVKFTLTDYTFKHITACIQLAFAIDSRYAQNRYLDIRKVTVAVNGGQGADATYTYNTTNGTATWSGTEADGNTLAVTATGDHWYLGDKTSLEGMHASERYHAYNRFYIKEQPCDEAPITLKVTYDVYDMEGLLTRKGAVAESTLTPGATITTSSGGKKSFLSGYYYNLLVYIIPDYLYILSDNDNGADATLVLK